MDLVSGAVGIKQAELASRVQYAVAGKIMDTQKSMGGSALKLLEAASKCCTAAGDQLTAAATGLGSTLDTYA